MVERHGEGLIGSDPAELAGFIVEPDQGFANAAAGVVEQNEMGISIKLLRVDAVLHEDKLDLLDVQRCFLLDFAAQGVEGGFTPFDLAAGNAPKVGPFVGADHEDFSEGIENERADGYDRHRPGFEGTFQRLELEVVTLQHLAQLGQVFDDEVRFRRAQLTERVVAGQHRAGMHAPVFGGLDVVLHVADEQRFAGSQGILFENFADFLSFVPNADIGGVDVFIEAGDARLDGEVVLVNRAEEKGANAMGPAELKELTGVREFADGILDLAKTAVEPAFELGQRDVRHVPVVKVCKRETELGAEFVEAHLGPFCLGENVIGRLEDSRQIVHECA